MIKKKIIVGIIILVTIMNLCGITNATTNNVEVAEQIEKELTYLYNANFLDRMLKYNDKLVYSISSLNEGVQQLDIEKTSEYENLQISNIILSGYPYKTPEELNCQSELEAYIATQEAIYIENEPRDIEIYVTKGERGKRILEAAKQIVQNARKVSTIHNIKLVEKNEELVEDRNDSNYLMKEYEISANGVIKQAKIEVIAGEDVKITDLNNIEKTTFKEKDNLKLLIPKNNTTQNISIKLEADFMKPKMQLAGSQKKGQNYGLVVVGAEEEKVSRHIDIKKGNLSTIKITNLTKDTNEPIVRAEFELLNKEYEAIQQELITNEKGEITINNIEPNTYYIRQNKTKEGYHVMNYITKVEVVAEDRISNVKIINDREKEEQITENNEKEILVEEENNPIKEINNKEITNIYNYNTAKEVTDNIKEKNYYYNRDFINNIRIKDMKNEQNNNVYKNSLYFGNQDKVYKQLIEKNNAQSKEDWMNYIELKTSGTSLLKLPKAGR